MTTADRLPRIEGIELLDVIARGGQSTVYRGRRDHDDGLVAVKVHDGLPATDARRRFERERHVLETISVHPAIVSLLGSGTTLCGGPYLALELATRGSLQDRLADGPLDVDEATALAVGLASALERAHRPGVTHRDVKPANIVGTADGRWKLTDFGVAAMDDGAATSTLHVSFGHAPPEAFDGGAAGPAGDVYSLASTLLTALTGEMPFGRRDDEAMAATVHRLATEPPPPLRDLGVPDPLARIIEAAMSKRPEERPPSAWFFGAAVDSVRTELGLARVGTGAPTGPAASRADETVVVRWAPAEERVPPLSPTPRRRRRAPVAAGALALSASIAVGALVLSSNGSGDAIAVDPASTVVVATTEPAPAPIEIDATDGGPTTTPEAGDQPDAAPATGADGADGEGADGAGFGGGEPAATGDGRARVGGPGGPRGDRPGGDGPATRGGPRGR